MTSGPTVLGSDSASSTPSLCEGGRWFELLQPHQFSPLKHGCKNADPPEALSGFEEEGVSAGGAFLGSNSLRV